MPRVNKRQAVADFVRDGGWASVGGLRWSELHLRFPDISDSTIRAAIAVCGVDLEQPWRGIAQHTLAELEISLLEYSRIYSEVGPLRGYCRQQVIAAKDLARIVSRSGRVAAFKRALKAEMVDWLLVWLSDPLLFPTWAALRRRRLEELHHES